MAYYMVELVEQFLGELEGCDGLGWTRLFLYVSNRKLTESEAIERFNCVK
jgi:hypothetical protein